MDKLIHVNVEEMQKDCPYLASKFHYNEMPKPFREITQEQFYNYLDTWCCMYQGSGQICRPNDLEALTGDRNHAMIPARYYFYAEKGLARLKFTTWSKETGHVTVTRYYELGCKHEWETIEADKFETVCKCKKCGLVHSFQTGY